MIFTQNKTKEDKNKKKEKEKIFLDDCFLKSFSSESHIGKRILLLRIVGCVSSIEIAR